MPDRSLSRILLVGLLSILVSACTGGPRPLRMLRLRVRVMAVSSAVLGGESSILKSSESRRNRVGVANAKNRSEKSAGSSD